MLIMRGVTTAGFGRKVREWNGRELLQAWREHWSDLVNEYLHRAGNQVRIDHRRKRDLADQATAAVHLGKAVSAVKRRGLVHERLKRGKKCRATSLLRERGGGATDAEACQEESHAGAGS
jgi:hypothetical protein